MRRRAPVTVLALAVLAAVLAPSPAAAEDVRYEPPVDAPVVDPFRPPSAPWSAGNRGLEYETAPGATVTAAADGRVVFAGPVAGTLHVTIEHADGVRTSYSFLATVGVRVGQSVRRGQSIATAGERFHLGARVDGRYIDPAALFDGRLRLRVRLVPHDDPERDARAAAMERAAERALLAELVAGGGGGPFGGLGGIAGAVVSALAGGAALAVAAGDATAGFLVERAEQRLRLLWHYTVGQIPARFELAQGVLTVLVAAAPPCSAAGVAVARPQGRRVAVLVGGLDSSTASAAIDDVDVARHGYDPADVVRFSYRGGIIPDPDLAGPGWDDDLAVHDYGPDDTRGDIRVSAVHLARLIEDVGLANPGTPVDVYAHSMGGLVLRGALAELQARGAPLPTLVITLATPHEGADLATAGAALRVGPAAPLVGGPGLLDVVDAAGEAAPLVEQVADLDVRDTAIRQLAETSDLIRELPPFPEGLEARSIGMRTDLVVPVPRLEVGGAEVVVVDGPVSLTAHDAVPGSAAANDEIALALAGMAPRCRGRLDRAADLIVGDAISGTEDLLGLWLLVA